MSKVFKFSASWCQPCKDMTRALSQIETQAEIVELDIDLPENKDLTRKHEIRSVPTLVMIDDSGNQVKRLVGMKPKQELENWLNGTE